MKINTKKLRSGDIVFTRSFGLMSWLTMLLTKSPVSHVGVVVKTQDNTLIAEMIGDFKRGDGDLEINNISKYLFGTGDKIVSIKRSPAFSQAMSRVMLKKEINKYIGSEYDWREILSFLSDRKNNISKKHVCSKFVYLVCKAIGVPWNIKNYQFYRKNTRDVQLVISPGDLYKDTCLYEVEGWRL